MAQHSKKSRRAQAAASLLLLLAFTRVTAAARAYDGIAEDADGEGFSDGAAVVHGLFSSSESKSESTDKPAEAVRNMEADVHDLLRRFMQSEALPSYPGSTPPPPLPPSPTPSPSPLPSLAVGLSDPCDICNDCLMVMSGVATASLAGASAEARSAALLTACAARPSFPTATCSALSNVILAGTTNTAARAGLLCVNLGACSPTSCAAPAVFNATKIGAPGTTLTGALDLCAAEGVAGGSPTLLPSATRTADSCRVASDCSGTGAVCSLPEQAAPQVCECAAGRDVCYSLGTCINYCALNSTLATVTSMNGGAAVCDPAAASNPACAANEVCAAPGAAAGGCLQWECDPSTQALKQVPCAGRCQPRDLKLLSAALADTGDVVTLTLSAAAAPLALVPCASVLDAASAALLGAAALCRSSGNSLTAQLTPAAKLMPGMSLTLLSAGSVLVGALDAARAFTGSAIVAKCAACASPKTVLAGPATITQPCASAAGGLLAAAASQPPAFDASTSTDPSGRAEWVDVKWALEAGGPEAGRAALAEAVERTNALAAARDRLRLSLTAAEASALEDGSYALKVTLTSWLGTSASAVATFAKASTSPAPLVQVVGAASGQTFKTSAGLRAAAEQSGPLCKGQSLEWRWAAVSPAGWAGMPVGGVAGQQLYLPAPVAAAVHGQRVGLKVTAAYVGAADASAFGAAELSLTAVGSAPLAALAGPSGDVADTQRLTFNATASSDPDATPDTQRLTYRWACRREDFPAPCFAGAAQGDSASVPGVWAIPAGLLSDGKSHTITVTVSKEVAAGASALEAVASITVRPRSADVPFPKGVLARACSAAACSAPHPTDTPLTVTLTLEPGYEAAAVDWSSPELSPAAAAALPGLVTAPGTTPAVRVLTLPAALLPGNRASITLAVNMSLGGGASSMNTTTIPLNSAPSCSLAAADAAASDAVANAGCLRLDLLDATFPTAAVAVHAVGWLDGQDSQLRYEFGVRDAASGLFKVQRVGGAASATLVGLPAGNVALYACALDSGGSRTCGSRVVSVAQPAAGFDVAAAAASLDVNALVESKDMGSLLQAGSSLANLLTFTPSGSSSSSSTSSSSSSSGSGSNGSGAASSATVDPAVGAAIAKQSVTLVSAILTAKRRLRRVAHLGLSAFGRASNASAYCTSMVTWHMEHSGMPDGVARELERLVARVVDRRLAPEAAEQRLTGIPTELLYGHPTAGGFGALPLIQHVRGRHATWAARLAAHDAAPATTLPQPWCVAYATFLHHHHPSMRPSSALTAVPAATGAGDVVPSLPLPEDAERTATALGWLPPVQALEPAPEPGAWCYTAPLWGNPLLSPPPLAEGGEPDPDLEAEEEPAPEAALAGAAQCTQGRGLDYRHRALRACAQLLTIGDLVRAYDARPLDTAAVIDWDGWLRAHLAPTDARQRRRGPTLAALQGLADDIPPAWLNAARAHAAQLAGPGPAPPPAPSTPSVISTIIMPRMGWVLPGTESVKIPLEKLSVRMATALQLDSIATRRAGLHEDYERAALGLPPRSEARREDLPEDAAAALGAFRGTLARLWQRVRWERRHFETLWRLAIDAVPLPGNTHMPTARREPCGCGQYGHGSATTGPAAATPPEPRQHHFWGCAVAKAVVAQINAHTPGPQPISQAQLWLVQAPSGVQQCVWDVVAMAALAAIEHGRVRLRGMTRAAAAQGDQAAAAAAAPTEAAAAAAAGADADPDEVPPTQLTPPQPGVNHTELACARAVADFWSRLLQFAQLGTSMSDPEAAQQAISVISAVAGSTAAFLPASAKAVMVGAAKAAAATIKSNAPNDFLSNICRLLGVSMPTAAAANSAAANNTLTARNSNANRTSSTSSNARRALLQAAANDTATANSTDPAVIAAARIADLLSVADRLGAALSGKAVPGAGYTALGDGGVFVSAAALMTPAPGAGTSAAVQALLRAGPDAAASASTGAAATAAAASGTTAAAAVAAAKPSARRLQRRLHRRQLAAESTTTTTTTSATTGSNSASASLLLTGASASAAAGLSLVLQYAPSAGPALQAALASAALPADTTLLTAAGITTATWRTASTGAAAPAAAAPVFDGSSASFLTLSIPAPGVDASRSVGCIAFDAATSAPTGNLIAGSLDAATGRVACRTDAAGSFLVAQGAALPATTTSTTTTSSTSTTASNGGGASTMNAVDQSAASGGGGGPSDPTVAVLSAVLGGIGAMLVAGVLALLYIVRKKRQAEQHGVVPVEAFHVVTYSDNAAFAPNDDGGVMVSGAAAGGFHWPTSVVMPQSPSSAAAAGGARTPGNVPIVVNSYSQQDFDTPVLAFDDQATHGMTEPVISTASGAAPSAPVWHMAARSSWPGSPEAGAGGHGSPTWGDAGHRSRGSVAPTPPPPGHCWVSGPGPWTPPRTAAPVASAHRR
ncbi:hypothetical protein HYH02_002723 [Chlamydomonas schloesseri]|uniref:PKD/REJ-like domain-containing protein n=1 Tax=Chlamydomonas schloesseri TaxID=2026947 RepID=A0A836BAZ6_9CHLO|nr:hypothetical protein HYH02_002723 [Chlamydomonas schloesseri]|eukprot:KAG2452484.1 hypothetical protein HYH02_002723 [Chlamydomonas schloesseri]